MVTMTITYAARCKHCAHLTRKRKTRKNGEPSKTATSYCGKFEKHLAALTAACAEFKL